jgi:hypothetical protein
MQRRVWKRHERMEAGAVFSRFTLLAAARRVMFCTVALAALLPASPSFAQQSLNNAVAVNHTTRSRRDVTGTAQFSSPGNQTQVSLPNAPSAVPRDMPTVGWPAPDEPFSTPDPASFGSQSSAGITSAGGAQSESEPLEWKDIPSGCARPKGFGRIRRLIADTLQVGTSNYAGGTIEFYVQTPRPSGHGKTCSRHVGI